MENWGKDGRRDVVVIDLEALVTADYWLRKIERVMDCEWLYNSLSPYYCRDNGRNGTDPVVLVKMVLIQHLFGSSSLRQIRRKILVSKVQASLPTVLTALPRNFYSLKQCRAFLTP